MYNEGLRGLPPATAPTTATSPPTPIWLAGLAGHLAAPRTAEALGPGRRCSPLQHARAAGPLRPATAGWCSSADQDRSALGPRPPSRPREAMLRARRRPPPTRAATSCRPRSPPATRPPRRGRPPTGSRSWHALRPPAAASTTRPWPALNRAVALAQLGPGRRRSRPWPYVDALQPASSSAYHLCHATRAQLLGALGRVAEAVAADERALALTTNEAERRLLATRLHRRPLDDGS